MVYWCIKIRRPRENYNFNLITQKDEFLRPLPRSLCNFLPFPFPFSFFPLVAILQHSILHNIYPSEVFQIVIMPLKRNSPNSSSHFTIAHRSPWSNLYEPQLDDGAMPSDRLRQLEIDANRAFDLYREMYFEGGVSSVYLWDLEHGFAGKYILSLYFLKDLQKFIIYIYGRMAAEEKNRN